MTTTTTNHLPRIAWPDRVLLWLRRHRHAVLYGLLGLAWAITLALVVPALQGPHSAPQAVPTPALSVIIATTQPTPAAQVAQVGVHVLARAVVAYDAPNGHVIGAIDQGHVYQVKARYGAEWVQADVVGSGLVWLRAADVFDLPSDLADLAPTVAPQVVYIASQVPPVPAVDPIVLPDAQVDAAFAAHQAREAAWANGVAAQPAPADHIPTSEDMPCNCP